MRVELPEQLVHVGVFEVVLRLFHLVLVVHVAVGHATERPVGPHEVEHALDALQVHREALETVGDLAHHRPAVEATHLLEVRELRDFHAVQPDLPAEPPGAQRRRLPVVLDEADVVHQRVDAHRAERTEVQLDDVRRRRLDDDLVLVVVLQAERVVAIAAVGRPARRLHVGGAPRLGAQRAQEGRRVKRAGSHLHVVRLQDHAAAIGPVTLERQDQVLESPRGLCHRLGHGVSADRLLQGGEV